MLVAQPLSTRSKLPKELLDTFQLKRLSLQEASLDSQTEIP